MYLSKGFKGLGQDAPDESGYSPYAGSAELEAGDWGGGFTADTSFSQASDTGPTTSINWTGLFNTAVDAYAKVKGSPKSPTGPAGSAPRPARPVSSPFTGALGGAGGLTLAAVGAGLIYMLMRR